ncbi:serine/threonine-protein kinase [Streptomyces erythrochromogenes]|uniref:serine/threonine-protein kinase n=1 Tax=Streptomyces erythrochromogenes TaxID=285574 RepID=UPI00224DFB4C|nr:serine/threonine protein kinase [Streptomyces erythrochromogenes]MCX5583786.1 protein kinase [Streptomyces erythrochromogenes]
MLELTGSGAEPLEAEDPRRIGPIPLAGRLGAGGMGRVYLGVQEGRYVAVKQLLASVVGEDEDFLRRFGHELDNLARLPAGATAPLLAGDRTARPPWFATAYVPGTTLREAITLHGGPLPADALWLLLREAAASLASVHALDMVHRDLKPSNVMLTLDGLTLIDFGVARAAEQSQLTRTGMVVGTPAYMAPEQASGKRKLSGATDVFALGSVLAYAACGRPPFGDESGHGVLYRIVHEEPDLEPLRDLEPELAELVEACLAKDPDDRPTAADLLERASRQGPFTQPLWPVAIDERLTERAAFAADVQDLDVPTLSLTDGKPDPAQAAEPAAPGPGPGATPAAGPRPDAPERRERRERRRRTRVLLAVLPVVVVSGGTTLAIQYLPHVSAPRAEAQDTPAAPVTAPAEPATAGGGNPSGTAPAAQPPARDPGQAPGAVGGAPVTAVGGTGTGPGPGPGTVPGGGSQPGSGGAGSSANAGGNGGGARPSAGGTSTAPTAAPAQPPPLPDSGTYRYRNGNNGKCITQVFGASDFGDCANGSARWTVQSRSDGSFKLVNQQSGSCLYSNGLGQAVFVGDCAQDIGRVWRTGPGGSLRSDLGGGCLDLGMSSGLVTRTCGGEASQRWTKQS